MNGSVEIPEYTYAGTSDECNVVLRPTVATFHVDPQVRMRGQRLICEQRLGAMTRAVFERRITQVPKRAGQTRARLKSADARRAAVRNDDGANAVH